MRVAAYQCVALSGNLSGNLARLAWAAKGAASLGADVLVLPELYLTGYVAGSAGAEDAFEPDSPVLEAVADIARGHGIALTLGYGLRQGGQVYNMAGLWDGGGQLLASYAKTHLWGRVERTGFAAGTHLAPTVALAGVRTGLLICYDVEFPEPCRALAGDGARLILAPTANMQPYTEVPTTLIRSRALENGIGVAYVNYVGGEGSLIYTGLSGIVGPDGQDLARAGATTEAMLIADLPDPFPKTSTQLRDRRPDLGVARHPDGPRAQ